jgi:hypothetical protein
MLFLAEAISVVLGGTGVDQVERRKIYKAEQ